jgi:hypothetical protein
MPIDTGTLIAGLALTVTIIGGGTAWILRWGKIEAAVEVAREAKVEADEVRKELVEFKERVARDYATAAMLSAFEGRITAAFERLGDRIDRLLESRQSKGN